MSKEKPVALITGAAKRIGKEITLALAGAGYRVAIHYCNSSGAAKTLADDIEARFGVGVAFAVQADLADMDACKNLPTRVMENFGRIDLLVNNASIFEKTPFEEVSPDEIDRFHTIHVKAPAEISIASAKYLGEKSTPGRIVNIVDIHSEFVRKDYLPYSLSKAGLSALTKTLAIELAPEILVNAISPGAILEPVGGYTPEVEKNIVAKIPLERFGEPSDIADALLYLARAKYVTGQTIVVDGGRTLSI